MTVLKIKNLSAGYGDIQVLKDINFSIKKGETIALLGANASGKTTFINSISGLVKPIKGEIYFEEKKIINLPAYKRVELGLIQICEGRNLFPFMTVEENLQLGAYAKRARLYLEKNIKMIYEMLPILYERRKQKAGSLSGGEQQMLAIGRGLMSNPKILMFDEPSLGLAPILVQKVFEIIKKIKEQNITILLVEQNVVKSLKIADRGYIMENGKITLSGEASKLLNDDKLRKAYMGI
jgi:branched-chain amino acid transport system ATP-binding protein